MTFAQVLLSGIERGTAFTFAGWCPDKVQNGDRGNGRLS